MFSGKIHLLLVAALLGSAPGSLFSGNFAPPAEGPVAFRRDQVPLDADSMSGLSRQLVTMAEGMDTEKDENRRTIAQMLALATALDPGNGKARELISQFKNGNSPASADPWTFEKTLHRVWQSIAWLERPEAGSQGRALATCLLDIMIVADPKNPRVEGLRAEGEHGAWSGWVPELAAYRAVDEIKHPSDEPRSTEDKTAQAKIPLAKAQVSAVLWKQVGNDESLKWIQASAPLKMSAEWIPGEEGASRPFSLVIGSNSAGSPVQALSPTLILLFKNQHVRLPAGQRVTIAGDALDRSIQSGKRQSISAAAAVLASAAISGVEPSATIIGTVNESGDFKLPSEFWNQLLALGPGNGGRLVLPTAAADYLPSMLALGKPQFFLDYEVLLASDFQELLVMSAKNPADPLAKASAQFKEIREKSGTQPVGQYVANIFIRRRFTDISQAAPYHFSAKMLIIQGAGNRPSFLPRVVLSAEIRRALEPLDWIVKMESPDLGRSDLEHLNSSYETCRTQLERLSRYNERKDQELVNHAQELLLRVRVLERAAKPHGEFSPSYEGTRDALKALTDSRARLIQELKEGEK